MFSKRYPGKNCFRVNYSQNCTSYFLNICLRYFIQWGVFGPIPEGHPPISCWRAMRCALWEVLIYIISALMSVYPIMIICLVANLDDANYFDILGMTVPFSIFTMYYMYVTCVSYIRIKGAGFGWNSIFVIIVLLSGVCNILDMVYVLHACIYYGLSNSPVAYNVVRSNVKSGANAMMRPSASASASSHSSDALSTDVLDMEDQFQEFTKDDISKMQKIN